MINTANNKWLIVGSSPNAAPWFDAAVGFTDVWMTTNSGWQLFLTADHFAGVRMEQLRADRMLPHYYWISDTVSCERNGRAMRFMQKRGTLIVTKYRPQFALRSLGLYADVVLDLASTDAPVFMPGSYVHSVLSGLICLQFAINSGAKTVVMVGMEGYRSGPDQIVVDSFDGRHGKAGSVDHTAQWIAPFTQSVIDQSPHVRFLLCGKLRYQVSGANVAVLDDPQQLHDAIEE